MSEKTKLTLEQFEDMCDYFYRCETIDHIEDLLQRRSTIKPKHQLMLIEIKDDLLKENNEQHSQLMEDF